VECPTLLKSITLPGDFEKYTVGSPGELGEKFYIAIDLPYEGEKFYDLSSLLEGKGMGRGGPPSSGPNPLCPFKEEEEEEKKEEHEHEEEHKHEKENECEDCSDDGENVQDILADAVNVHLKKIAELLGRKGDHEAAYMVERTIRSISREAENGKLFSK